MKDNKLERRGRRVKASILSVFLAVVAFVVAAFLTTVYLIERQTRERDLADGVHAVETLLQQKITKDAGLMHAVTLALFDNREVEQAMVREDRWALMRSAGPLFEALRKRHGITHLYFTNPSLVNVLRLHDHDYHGDTIDRFTTLRARDTGSSTHGLELGPIGTLTLRTVTPWQIDGKVIGYVEFGEEIGQLLLDIRATLGLDLYAFIDKGALSRTVWEQRSKFAGRSGQWEEHGDIVLAAHTSDAILPSVIGRLRQIIDGETASEGSLFLAGRPLADATGRVIGTLVIARDVSELERTFRRSLIVATLISVLAGVLVFTFFTRALGQVQNDYRRQHDLERRMLRMSSEHQRMIQVEKLSAVGTMIGEIAHQLNNPLVGVVNMAQLAERSADDPARVRELLAEIRKAGHDCRTFVRRMLDFTKVSHSERRSTDLGAVTQESVALFHQSSGRDVAVDLRLPERAVAVADPILLRHALFNLLTNAGQAMGGQGAVTVSVSPAKGEEGQAGWALTVEDEGPGLSDEVRARLFTPFFTTRTEGTGLGLPVVLHVALMHDGYVQATNREGRGARFAIWIPETQIAEVTQPKGALKATDAGGSA